MCVCITRGHLRVLNLKINHRRKRTLLIRAKTMIVTYVCMLHIMYHTQSVSMVINSLKRFKDAPFNHVSTSTNFSLKVPIHFTASKNV